MKKLGLVTGLIFGMLLISSSLLAGCVGSPAGLKGPKTLSTGEKEEAIAIAFQAPQIASLIDKGAPYTVRLGWSAIVWDGSGTGYSEWSSFGEDAPEDPDIKNVPTGALWYPEVIIATGTGTIWQAQIAVDLDTHEVAAVNGPYPSLSSPGRFTTSTPAP
jgi:hypothetical protein